MKKLRNFLPIEFYFILLPSIFIFLLSLSSPKTLPISALGTKQFLKDSSIIAAPYSISVLILLLIIFICALVPIFCVLIEMFSYLVRKGNKSLATNWKHIIGIFFTIFLILFAGYSLTLCTNFIFKISDPIKTANMGKLFLSWDRAIFKTDPGIWLINKFGGTFLEKVFLLTYNSLFLLLAIILLISFIFNKKAFRKLLLSFFISWMISLPLWFLFPTLSPDFMFRQNKLKLAAPQECKAFNNFKCSDQLKENLQFQDGVHIVSLNPNQKSLSTSTFPSMHAAWGVIIAYSGIAIWPWLGIILIPFAILNCISAVYILEHFVVDIILGIFVAIISIVVTELLLRFEKKYFEDKFGLLSGIDYIQSAFKNFASAIKKIIK